MNKKLRYYLTKKWLAFWIKVKVFPNDTKFGDKICGATLTEVKRLG